MPKREFSSVSEFEIHVGGAKELIFDGTENLTERPQVLKIRKISLVVRKGRIQI